MGKVVEVKEPVDGNMIQIFHLGERIASHQILPKVGQWSIDPSYFQGVISRLQSW
jgi:hypothetical protein